MYNEHKTSDRTLKEPVEQINIELLGEYYKNHLESIQKKLINPLSLHGAHHRNLNRFIQENILQLHEGSHVLDAGCGLSIWVTPEIDKKIRYVGIDCQQESVEFCKKHYPNRDYKMGDLYKLPFADKFFDAVVMREVIEHFKMPEKAIAEVTRVLKPSGIFILTTPNYGNPLLYIIEHTYNRFFGGPCKPYLPDVHPSRFNRISLVSLLKESFKDVEVTTLSIGITLAAVAQTKYRRP